MSESLNDKLEALFKARPYEWIDGKELAEVAGGYAWRTRVSNLRKQRGMEIGNDVVRRWDAQGKPFKTSYYRYVPPVETHVEASGQVAFL
jgi:hypothetical protein